MILKYMPHNSLWALALAQILLKLFKTFISTRTIQVFIGVVPVVRLEYNEQEKQRSALQ